MDELISKNKLYNKCVELENKAFEHLKTPLSQDEWNRWNAILAERTAYKHDVADMPVEKIKSITEVLEEMKEDDYFMHCHYGHRRFSEEDWEWLIRTAKAIEEGEGCF